jgi:cyclase
VYTDCGRERSGVDAVEWARRGVELGAGEILLTSIDQEGTRKGFDTALTRAIASAVSVPVIASGGYGEPRHLAEVVSAAADAVAIADALHYNRTTMLQLREAARAQGIKVREA